METAAFLDQLRGFTSAGAATEMLTDSGIPYLVNAFWTAGQRQGHSLHEISYRACFKPQLPGFFIDRLTAPGEAVLDPFMGRGTTPLQAALSGRRPLGNDINPLSLRVVALSRLGSVTVSIFVQIPSDLTSTTEARTERSTERSPEAVLPAAILIVEGVHRDAPEIVIGKMKLPRHPVDPLL